MASIFIYDRSRRKCVQLNTPRLGEEEIAELKSILPPNIEGIAFSPPFADEADQNPPELWVEERESKVAEYLKNIGAKLERLNQLSGAIRFYDMAFRLSGNSDALILKARVLSERGQADRALHLLDLYSEKRPEAPEPYFMQGKLALSRSDYTQAQKQFAEAERKLRPNNVEHKKLEEVLKIYQRFVAVYLDRDQLFNRNLSPQEYISEIEGLRQRTQVLIHDIRHNGKAEVQGMLFFLETQDKIFEKWLEEMRARLDATSV